MPADTKCIKPQAQKQYINQEHIHKIKNVLASAAAIVPMHANIKYARKAKPSALVDPAASPAPKVPALIIQLIATPDQKKPNAPKIDAPKIFLWQKIEIGGEQLSK